LVTGSYSGVHRFAEAQKLKKSEVKDALKDLESYYLYKPVKKPSRRPIVVNFANFQISFDLIDLIKYSKYNKNYKYVLVVIDNFTRKLYTEALKTKTAKEVITAFKRVFKRMKKLPKYATSDMGKEFTNKEFVKFLETKKIKYFNTFSEIKSSMAERVIRTIMTRISKYWHQNNTKNYIDA